MGDGDGEVVRSCSFDRWGRGRVGVAVFRGRGGSLPSQREEICGGEVDSSVGREVGARLIHPGQL